MALTPEDVVNKRFQPTKFREGYDQDEVDDFLDEVVVELRRLGLENEELRQRLTSSQSQSNESQREEVFAAPVVAPVADPVATGIDPSLDPNNTNNLLQLARRLHEEHVREGIEKRDALIAEGHATAARIVGEAEQQQRSELASLDQERQSLEGRIDELRAFEREYREKLKGHIESILHDLDGTAAPANVSAHSAPAAASFAPAQSEQAPFATFGAAHSAPTTPAEPALPEPSQANAFDQDSSNLGGIPAQPQTGFPGFVGN